MTFNRKNSGNTAVAAANSINQPASGKQAPATNKGAAPVVSKGATPAAAAAAQAPTAVVSAPAPVVLTPEQIKAQKKAEEDKAALAEKLRLQQAKIAEEAVRNKADKEARLKAQAEQHTKPFEIKLGGGMFKPQPQAVQQQQQQQQSAKQPAASVTKMNPQQAKQQAAKHQAAPQQAQQVVAQQAQQMLAQQAPMMIKQAQQMKQQQQQAPVVFGPQPRPVSNAPVVFGPQPKPVSNAPVVFGPQPKPVNNVPNVNKAPVQAQAPANKVQAAGPKPQNNKKAVKRVKVAKVNPEHHFISSVFEESDAWKACCKPCGPPKRMMVARKPNASSGQKSKRAKSSKMNVEHFFIPAMFDDVAGFATVASEPPKRALPNMKKAAVQAPAPVSAPAPTQQANNKNQKSSGKKQR